MAYKILETAQSPNSSFPFLFDLRLGHWDLGLGLGLVNSAFLEGVQMPLPFPKLHLTLT